MAQFWRYVSVDLMLGTKSGYPLPVQIGHNLASILAYRRWHDAQGDEDDSALYQFFGAYFCFAYGGTSMRDLWLGTAVCHASCQLAAQSLH